MKTSSIKIGENLQNNLIEEFEKIKSLKKTDPRKYYKELYILVYVLAETSTELAIKLLSNPTIDSKELKLMVDYSIRGLIERTKSDGTKEALKLPKEVIMRAMLNIIDNHLYSSDEII